MPRITVVDLTGETAVERVEESPESPINHEQPDEREETEPLQDTCCICYSHVAEPPQPNNASPHAILQCQHCRKCFHLSCWTSYSVELNAAPSLHTVIKAPGDRATLDVRCPLCRGVQCTVSRCEIGIQRWDALRERIDQEIMVGMEEAERRRARRDEGALQQH